PVPAGTKWHRSVPGVLAGRGGLSVREERRVIRQKYLRSSSSPRRNAVFNFLRMTEVNRMIQLKLVGWNKGLQTVSLIRAVCECANIPLPSAKALVENLLAGNSVTIEFLDRATMERFREVATSLGVTCG